jgi:hypothetical protein
MRTTEDDTAAQLLAELVHCFRERPVTGPAGHSYIASEPRGTATHPGAPLNLTVVDHIDATVRELADYTRETNPGAEPLPPHVEAVYAWCLANTQNAPEDIQQRRDTLIYRQRLEHAIAMGDIKAVRPIRCPKCRTLSIMWPNDADQRALCTNGNCLDKDGLSNRFTLAQLAHSHIAGQQKSVRVRAT